MSRSDASGMGEGEQLCLWHDASRTAVVLGGAPVAIGRDAECAVILADHLVSRVHALIEPTIDGQLLLRDLGSTNGTFLNGVRLPAEQAFALREGDVVEVGADRLAVMPGGPSLRASSWLGRSGSDHDLDDLVRDGLLQLSTSALAAFDLEVQEAIADADLERALGRLRAHVSCERVMLVREGRDGELRPIAEHPGAWGSKDAPPFALRLASRALVERRGLLIHGHGPAGEDVEPALETSVLGQWSAAAVPLLDGERDGPAGAIVAARALGTRLDRSDLALLAVLGQRFERALLRAPAVPARSLHEAAT